jgi:hypothetical protein
MIVDISYVNRVKPVKVSKWDRKLTLRVDVNKAAKLLVTDEHSEKVAEFLSKSLRSSEHEKVVDKYRFYKEIIYGGLVETNSKKIIDIGQDTSLVGVIKRRAGESLETTLFTRIGSEVDLSTIPPLFNLSERDEYEGLSPEMIALRDELYQVLYSPDRMDFLKIEFARQPERYRVDYLADLFYRLPDDRLRNRLLGFISALGIEGSVKGALKELSEKKS